MAIYFPSYNPTYSASKKSEPLTTKTRFGDGYQQRVNFGFNQNPKEWSLSFNVSEQDADAIESFLNARALDCQPFDWTPPDSPTSYRWICSSWTRELFDIDRSRIDVVFKQVFEPSSLFIYGYAPGFNEVVSYDFIGGTAYSVAPGINAVIEADFVGGSVSVPAPGINAIIDALFIGGAASTDGITPPVVQTSAVASFWSDWAYYDPDIFLYAQAAAETPVYWNRWQSWTEDPPLLFEESS